MVKRVKVQLWGHQNRAIDIDADASEGAVIGRNVFNDDGSLFTPSTVTTVVTTPSGTVSVAPSLWALILDKPPNIVELAALADVGLIARVDSSGTMEAREIQGQYGRIGTLDGDGAAGNPQILLGDWPTVRNSIGDDQVYTIPEGHQMLVHGVFVFDGGTLVMDGDLIVL